MQGSNIISQMAVVPSQERIKKEMKMWTVIRKVALEMRDSKERISNNMRKEETY